MGTAEYRIESNQPLRGRLLAGLAAQDSTFHDRALAVAMAAKSLAASSGQEIRVVHVPTGEVVFRKTAFNEAPAGDDGL